MKIIITDKAYLKLNKFVTLVNSEISGMAKSTIDKEKNILITDFMIFDQKVTGSSTILSDESQAKFINELMKKEEDTSSWNIWWHSHCDMPPFWSAIDDKTIESPTTQSYLISLVVNKKMEMKARLDIFPTDTSPFKEQSIVKYDIEDIEILQSKEEIKRKEKYEKEIEKLTEEYEKKLKEINKTFENINNKKAEIFCQKEIDLKVKQKTYLPNKFSFKKKKWNWFDGIIINLDDYTDSLDDENFLNTGKEIKGFLPS